jgi:Glutamate synthase domain 2
MPLYRREYEHDACGVGLAVDVHGRKTREIVEFGLRINENMAHRGAENADRTGDGAGITVQIPHEFILSQGIQVPEEGRYGTGLVFLPKHSADECMDIFRKEVKSEGLHLVSERNVPVRHGIPGKAAQECEPKILQVFITSYDSQEQLEHKLYKTRKRIEKLLAHEEEFYICSLSTSRMVYKGMLTPAQLRQYYPDLSDPLFKSAIAMVHSRFSTNTMPAWRSAQPFRLLCHNGEINTIKGNRSWMSARESVMSSEWFDVSELYPVLQENMSDSASLDNTAEFISMSGKSVPHTMSMLIPESWNDKNPIPDDLKAFYEYHSILMEPWDGPAAVLFTDGRSAGGMLDRNGLRPLRYTITKDGMLIMASEAGVIPVNGSDILEKGKLRPGKMLIVDTEKKTVSQDNGIKETLSKAYPYREWLNKNRVELGDVMSGREPERAVSDIETVKETFGYCAQDESVIISMAETGREPLGSMGNDSPIPVLSERPQRLFNYFRQSFAQVTNPPIDPIREELVMSITGYAGSIHWNILDPMPEHCKVVKIKHPVMTNKELDLLMNLEYKGFATSVIRMTFDPSERLEDAIERMCTESENAVDAGSSYIVLSDRSVCDGMIPIPSALAVAAVHSHLIKGRKRIQTALIVESGEPREVMHHALLFGYGANAVNPYMAFAVLDDAVKDDRIKMDIASAEHNYISALEKGILKVMSKMGIATLRSYRGAGLFETLGISKDVADRYFSGTPSPIGGISLDDIERAAKEVRSEACGKETHSWSAKAVKELHKAVSGDREAYERFKETQNTRTFIRDAMSLRTVSEIPIDSVESAEMIMRRFSTGAMSFGSISAEAHETLAEAMNIIGGQSNTGEGGEDPKRFTPCNGRNIRSSIKQIASGRFGVTAEYLVNADEIQIKVAQGAKPGEGGQLIGHKVNEIIAATRHTLPGVTLISPPPHHDIYSIEDLAQLIYDMRCINPKARISVKLVSCSGVGTIAVGVAKAGADVILISGADGGTGASPASSIKHAGMPWEIGLAETQQTLVMNGLRERVRVQTDGQMKTGRDVIVAALLGAEEYSFSTAPLVALGCVMDRKCHLNTCPVGIATQDPERRKRFKGSANDLICYFRHVAEDVREWLAKLGFCSLNDIIGRADLISPADERIDISDMIETIPGAQMHNVRQADPTAGSLDKRMIKDAGPAFAGSHTDLSYKLRNTDRSVGTMLSGEVVRSSKDVSISIRFTGSAGQSFGAFLVKGIDMELKGEANDYVGKGMSGGRISIIPDGNGDVIAGNTVMYGATSGELYIRGKAGERFAVRNSGAVAVAEGIGDHGCEYMTGGKVVILGSVGRNFAAGMSGGSAYVLNEDGNFDRNCNMGMVELSLVDDPEELKGMIESHRKYTGSPKAETILKDWSKWVKRFLKVVPVQQSRS